MINDAGQWQRITQPKCAVSKWTQAGGVYCKTEVNTKLNKLNQWSRSMTYDVCHAESDKYSMNTVKYVMSFKRTQAGGVSLYLKNTIW